MDGLLLDGFIHEKTHDYVIVKEPRPSCLYINPKIHKQGNPGRPIVSANDHPTERISEFVDHHLNPEAPKLPSYIKDTTHFLTKLNSLKDIPTGAIIVALDVASLYTNIPRKDGIQACRDALDQRTEKLITTERLCDMIRMILTMSTFEFNGEFFVQKHGTAMGTKMAPGIREPLHGKV